jgi:hypothetical protein
MSFIQRELDKIEAALDSGDLSQDAYIQLYAAQQALSWALDPTGYRSPYNTIKGIVDDQTNGLLNATLNDPVDAA